MKRTVTVVGAMCLAVAAVLTLRAQTPAADIPKIDIQKFTLPNGLEVILSENHRLPMVAVDLWYHVGPVNEAANRTGFAHLFEHMMFQGSKHLPGDQHFKLLEGAGATGINGTTDFDRTNYFETVPANQLELALWLESDRMGYLIDQIDQANLSNQQDVVRNERRQSRENRPYGMVEEASTHMLFSAEHPYYGNVIGSHADIQAAKLEDVRQFFKTYYRPNNATIAIVGDIDKAATRKLVEKYFGPLKRGVPVPKADVSTPPLTAEKRAVVTDRVELPRVYMTWLTPGFFKPGDADADIAGVVLGGGRSSRLYKSLVYEKQIAQAVRAGQGSAKLTSLFEIQATARPGHTAEEMEAAINEELVRFRNEGPTAAEVERARNTQETQTIRGLQSLGGFGGVADLLNLYNHFVGTPDYLAQDIVRHRNVTPVSVQRFAQQWLKDNARVVVYGVPGPQNLGPEVARADAQTGPLGSQNESVNEDEPWRATAPKPAVAGPVHFPVAQSFRLANGLTVILVEQSPVPFVSANLVVRTGSDASPVDKAGLANFSVSMLNQGTITRSAPQLADDTAQIGATLGVNSTMDASTVSIASLARNFPAALNILADVVLRPSFPADEVERQRATRLANLVQQRANPGIVVNAVMAAALYGQAHPYGFTELGTPESTRKITRDELQAFWKEHFVPGNAALVVAGAITQSELRRLVDAAFGAWPAGTSSPASLGDPISTKARLVVVDRPGSPQTQIRVASIGAPRSSPDYVPLRVMNDILGGLFSSRINLNLREAHGYTYGASSQFTFRRSAGPFLVGSGIRTDVTAPAVQEIFNELQKMITTSVTPDELALAKDSYARSLPSAFETTESAVASFSTMFTYGLPLDYFATLPDRIRAVTAQDVQAVAKRYLVPEKMVVVAVGDRAKIGPGLEAQLGPSEIRDPDGALLKP
jgi:zinc protease